MKINIQTNITLTFLTADHYIHTYWGKYHLSFIEVGFSVCQFKGMKDGMQTNIHSCFLWKWFPARLLAHAQKQTLPHHNQQREQRGEGQREDDVTPVDSLAEAWDNGDISGKVMSFFHCYLPSSLSFPRCPPVPPPSSPHPQCRWLAGLFELQRKIISYWNLPPSPFYFPCS